ncbi:hypothetical protein M501DRAFT_1003584 [Patellaria atrata CBS 101060]|uniref:Uncharacterized protein n=1 Tax=Patellaria atrata CBS 101060 TaxID=1346257 RepID=A0A9P4VRN6_9PEZI|nr:hypothetical protein M501DRAFT_1003584 [Patellaria atrata CBS 101060]
MANQDLKDDYVAELLKEDAKNMSFRYTQVGLQAFLPSRPTTRAPKPNTRFLRNIIRETDNHNSALLAKEAQESRTKLRDLGIHPSSRPKHSDSYYNDRSGPKKRRRADEDDTDDRDSRDCKRSSRFYKSRRLRSPDKSERSSRDRVRRRDKDWRRRDYSETEDDYHESHRRSRRHHRSKKDSSEGRSRSRSRSSERRRDRRHRSKRHRSVSENSTKDRGSHRVRKRRPTPECSHSRSRTRSRSISRASPHRKSHRRRRSRTRSRSTSPNAHKNLYSGDGEVSRLTPRSTQLAAPTSNASDSDPLEAIVGPLPHSPGPVVRSRGRGVFKSSLGMDARFAQDYDPTLDVRPDSDLEGDWDQAVEAYRDRQRWKQQGAERLRAAGFSEGEVKRWGKGGEKNEEDVRWAKTGEGREWDRGKVINDEGHIELKPEWGRIKGT